MSAQVCKTKMLWYNEKQSGPSAILFAGKHFHRVAVYPDCLQQAEVCKMVISTEHI